MISEFTTTSYICDGCKKELTDYYRRFVVHKGSMPILDRTISLDRSVFCNKTCFDLFCLETAENIKHNLAHPGFVGMGT